MFKKMIMIIMVSFSAFMHTEVTAGNDVKQLQTTRSIQIECQDATTSTTQKVLVTTGVLLASGAICVFIPGIGPVIVASAKTAGGAILAKYTALSTAVALNGAVAGTTTSSVGATLMQAAGIQAVVPGVTGKVIVGTVAGVSAAAAGTWECAKSAGTKVSETTAKVVEATTPMVDGLVILGEISDKHNQLVRDVKFIRPMIYQTPDEKWQEEKARRVRNYEKAERKLSSCIKKHTPSHAQNDRIPDQCREDEVRYFLLTLTMQNLIELKNKGL